jgi:CysZ protein
MFTTPLKILFGDKIILLFSMIPVAIGILLYYLFGHWIYGDILGHGKEWISQHVSSQGLNAMLFYTLVGILTIVLFFIINWTFVLIVSFLSSPFNDLISSRVEKRILGQNPPELKEGFLAMLKKIKKIFWNEFKKILLIAVLSLASVTLSFFPLLAPASLIISSWLMASTFLDYSWSRHELTFAQCLGDFRRGFLKNSILGIVFIFLMSIPVVNILALPIAVVSFTMIFVQRNNPLMLKDL